jgi:small subunit ribosomal protein S20
VTQVARLPTNRVDRFDCLAFSVVTAIIRTFPNAHLLTPSDRTRHVPNIRSAKKRMRQDAKRHSRNLWRKRRIKDQVKAFLKAVHDGDVKAAQTEFNKTCSVLDKIAATRTIHRNTASRRKSRLSARLKAMQPKKH